MDIRAIIDAVFLAQAGEVGAIQESIQNAVSRFDVPAGVDRWLFVSGFGHLLGFPTRPGTSCTATTGVPTNSITGFAKSALFLNFLGSAGSLVYTNAGTNTSTTWLNIA